MEALGHKTRTLPPRSALLSAATRKDAPEKYHELLLPFFPPWVTVVWGSIFKSCSGLPDLNKNKKFRQKHNTHRNNEPHGAITRNKRWSSSPRTGDPRLQEYLLLHPHSKFIIDEPMLRTLPQTC